MSNITVGCLVETSWGEAVCCLLQPHIHSLVPYITPEGWTHCGCADDSCREAQYCMFRYEAVKPDGTIIWVANGDYTSNMSYVGPATELSMRVAAIDIHDPYGRLDA